jgi:tRNA A37 threonylcarbamoyltransferase TsaD
MPGVLSPELAARIELILIDGVVEAVDERSELTADVELIASTCIPGRHHAANAYPWIWVSDPDT